MATATSSLARQLRNVADLLDQAQVTVRPLLARAGQGFILAPPGGDLIALDYSVGLHYLALIVEAGGALSATRLVELVSGRSLAGTAGQVHEREADGPALADYARALKELTRRRDEGDASAETGRRIAFLEKELRRGQRGRVSGDGERQRKVVFKAIARALKTVGRYSRAGHAALRHGVSGSPASDTARGA